MDPAAGPIAVRSISEPSSAVHKKETSILGAKAEIVRVNESSSLNTKVWISHNDKETTLDKSDRKKKKKKKKKIGKSSSSSNESAVDKKATSKKNAHSRKKKKTKTTTIGQSSDEAAEQKETRQPLEQTGVALPQEHQSHPEVASDDDAVHEDNQMEEPALSHSNAIQPQRSLRGSSSDAAVHYEGGDDDIAPPLPAVLPAINDRRGRATEPGALHVHPRGYGRQAEEEDESTSSHSEAEDFHDDDGDNEDGDTNFAADGDAVLIQAELVDEDAMRQLALLDTVQATAELLEDEDHLEHAPQQYDEDNNQKHSRWVELLLGRNSKQRAGFAPLALTCCCLITLAVVVPAVVLANNNNGGNTGTDSTLQPSASPSSFPSLMPTESKDTPWELVTDDALDGQVSDPFSFGGGPAGPLDQEGGEFGDFVSIGDIPNQDGSGNSPTNKTFFVLSTYGNEQVFPENNRKLRGRNLEISETKKLAIYLCHTLTGCEPGAYLSGSYTAKWNQFAMSGDGMRLAMAVQGRLLLFFFAALGVDPFLNQDAGVRPVQIVEARNTTMVAMNRDGSLVAAASSDELFVFSVFEGLGEPGSAPGDELSRPNLHSNNAAYFWDNQPGLTEKIVGLACNGVHVAFATNDDNQGFQVRVLRQGYEQYVGQTIENRETGWSIVYEKSLQLTASGTILAFSSVKSSVGGGGASIEQVEVYQLVDNDSTWVLLGQPLQSPKDGIAFGASLSLSEDGTILAVGAPLYSTNREEKVGRVFTYRLEAGQQWVLLGEAFGRSDGSESGRSVALSSSGDVLVVGSPKSGLRGTSTGEVNVYSLAE